jgi:hypothetical protein
MPSRVDANQPEIVRALRQVGASVQHLHTVGQGCPDIAVGFRGETYLLEIKMPGKALTDDEAGWHERWRGQVAIVYGVEDALRAIGAIE